MQAPDLKSNPSHNNRPQHPTAVIQPTRGIVNLPWREFWRFRELLFFLVWRDLKVRYKQSVLGVGWIILQPLLTMVIFTVIFNKLLGIGSGSDLPYPVVTFSALLPWIYFSTAVTRSSTSLVVNSSLVSKIYFPRLFIPLSYVLPGLVDFGVSFIILLGMMAFYQIKPSSEIIFLPVAILLAMFTALGVSLWFSALHTRYRDIQHLVPFLVQVWMYTTPIFYPIEKIPPQYLWLYNLNPMVGVVQYFRRVLLGDPSFGGINWISVLITVILLMSGMMYFRHVERTFADII